MTATKEITAVDMEVVRRVVDALDGTEENRRISFPDLLVKLDIVDLTDQKKVAYALWYLNNNPGVLGVFCDHRKGELVEEYWLKDTRENTLRLVVKTVKAEQREQERRTQKEQLGGLALEAVEEAGSVTLPVLVSRLAEKCPALERGEISEVVNGLLDQGQLRLTLEEE